MGFEAGDYAMELDIARSEIDALRAEVERLQLDPPCLCDEAAGTKCTYHDTDHIVRVVADRDEWQRRAQRAEAGLMRIAAELLGYDSTDEVSISYGEHGHSGPGWYGYVGEYPEEGSTQLFDLRARAEAERLKGDRERLRRRIAWKDLHQVDRVGIYAAISVPIPNDTSEPPDGWQPSDAMRKEE